MNKKNNGKEKGTLTISVKPRWTKRREGKRERESVRERWKARRVNPTLRLMLSPNYGTRACKKGRGTRTVPSLRGESSGIMSRNYCGLSVGIIRENYHLLYQWRRIVEIYRDTGYPKMILSSYHLCSKRDENQKIRISCIMMKSTIFFKINV